jgi:hypothetical protein
MKDLFELIKSINQTMNSLGFHEKISIGNDNIIISEKEVIINMPYTLTLKIPKESFESKEKNVIKDAVSQAINRAISVPVSRGN